MEAPNKRSVTHLTRAVILLVHDLIHEINISNDLEIVVNVLCPTLHLSNSRHHFRYISLAFLSPSCQLEDAKRHKPLNNFDAIVFHKNPD